MIKIKIKKKVTIQLIYFYAMAFLIHSPLEQFEVTSLISLNLPVLGYINLSLTNLGLYTILTVYLVLALHIMGSNNKQLIPSRWSIALESSFA